jgi:hypothetical protein
MQCNKGEVSPEILQTDDVDGAKEVDKESGVDRSLATLMLHQAERKLQQNI